MKNFKILIYNDSQVIVFNEMVQAENENKAVIKVLANITLYSDDTIKVEKITD